MWEGLLLLTLKLEERVTTKERVTREDSLLDLLKMNAALLTP